MQNAELQARDGPDRMEPQADERNSLSLHLHLIRREQLDEQMMARPKVSLGTRTKTGQTAWMYGVLSTCTPSTS